MGFIYTREKDSFFKWGDQFQKVATFDAGTYEFKKIDEFVPWKGTILQGYP